MATLYLVRHGQASFGAADYDQLSDLGARQCEQLGRHLGGRGLRFGSVFSGTLRRHAQSLQALSAGLGATAPARIMPELDEYDSLALVRCLHPEPLPELPPGEAFRHHFRLLREALKAWAAGRIQPQGMPTHAQFAAGVGSVLDQVRQDPSEHVLLVSSGGPISAAVGLVLGLAADRVIDLNMRIRNSAVTELGLSPGRQSLLGFNSVAHLEHPERLDWITFA